MKTFSLAAALAATFSIANGAAVSCSADKKCPSDTPCCSQYGQCGVGAYCLGGCDPRSSFDLQSCVAAPTCKSQDYKLTSLSDIAPNTKYLGDSSKANWVSSGTPVAYDNSVLLTMAPNTVGTLLTSTHYVWYGKISATLTTSQGQGVVTAFILMSDVKDEIDFEFVGVDLEHAQSNFYYQGITDYNNGKNLTVSNTVQNTHTYTIDWNPDSVTWSIDGQSMRTVKRSDTWNATTSSYHFPQTPARVQLSLWPAGLQSNGQGTIDWAGGLVNWDSPLMQNGYYFARVSDVNVQCYSPPSGFNQNHGDQAYYYTSGYGTNDTVAIGNNNTILSSLYASGDNPSYCPSGCSVSASGSSSAATSAPTPSGTPETVPGVSGGGNAGNSGSTSNQDTSGNAEGGGAAAGSNGGSSGSSGSSSGGGTTSFSQGGSSANTNSGSGSGSGSGSSGGRTSEASHMFAGSAVALLAFFAAALVL